MKYNQDQFLKIEEDSLNYETLIEHFYAAHTSWGGSNGGVNRDNVFYDPQRKAIVIRACGDLHKGGVRGVDRKGQVIDNNTRVGGCLVTKRYYGPGSFRFLVQLPQKVGVCSAIWVYHYTQVYENDQKFIELNEEGLTKKGEQGNFHYIRNHQIDIQTPVCSNNEEDISYKNIRFCTWRSLEEHTSKSQSLKQGLNDGKFHELRFDWFTLKNNPRVEFYVDGSLQSISMTNVPDIAGRVWIGLWFPSKEGSYWAGKQANFETEQLLIKKIEFIPFEDSNRVYNSQKRYKKKSIEITLYNHF